MSSSDWRSVKVKEEPVSDYEGSRNSKSSRHESRSGSRRQRSRSRSPSSQKFERRQKGSSDDRMGDHSRYRGRDDRNGERRMQIGGEGRTKQERRSRSPMDDRVKHERMTGNEERRSIKREQRSTSPRFRSPPRRNNDERRSGNSNSYSNRETRRHQQPSTSTNNMRSNHSREQDWDNFFNPQSKMSQQASAKRDEREQERKVAVGEGEFGKNESDDSEKTKEKEQPNFGLSGKLTEETNTFRGVVIKYSEPPEARKPNKIRWRFYPFKGEEALPVMYVHRQSAYLIGRDRKVADIPVDHPSCSKQHAVLQYRLVPYQRPDGSKGRRIRPYIIDLESANGTYVNGKQIDAKRYVELFEKDVLKFGYSSREYVLLHDESKAEDDIPDLTPD